MGKSRQEVAQLLRTDPGTFVSIGFMAASNGLPQWAQRLEINPQVGLRKATSVVHRCYHQVLLVQGGAG